MRVDAMVLPGRWDDVAAFARAVQDAGLAGLQFTEISQPPWVSIAVAAQAAPALDLATGVAVAFPRSPMVTALTAWELAANTGGRFRLGLGSQVRAHVERRYGVPFDPPVSRMRDYVLAVKACFRAFRQQERLAHEGPHYRLSLLPPAGMPARHDHEDVTVDIAAVGPAMCRTAGEVADGVHVHPLHSPAYLRDRLLPDLAVGAARAGRDPGELALTIPVLAVPGDTPEERAPLLLRARQQIAFYGSTRNYAFQFDDLGFPDTSARLYERMKAGKDPSDLVTDDMLEHFAIVCRWDEVADRVAERYAGIATRLVLYLAQESGNLGRWGEIARALPQ